MHPFHTLNMWNFIKKHKVTIALILLALAIGGIAHGFNMFKYPYLEDDEGTYMSQAWSLITHGSLAPYTYWYDHAPMGWILIALWTTLTGGFFTFGLSINSGRVLMLIMHLFSIVLLFGITKKLTRSNFAAFIATLLFSLSPVGVYFQRRVLLDNPMIFWVLLSLFLLLGNGKKLSHYILSAICLGLGVLTKEPAIFFLPSFLYIVYDTAHNHHKIFAVVKYFLVCSAVISLYILYAVLRNELFPTGTLLGGSNPHVSLISTFMYQASRKGGFFLDSNSGFRMYLSYWVQKDGLLILGGIVATVLNLLFSFKSKAYLYITFITLSFWLFLIRGGEVIEFYITPFIPILSLSIAAALYKIIDSISKPTRLKIIKYILFSLVLITMAYYYYMNPYFSNLYTQDQTSAQKSAIEWVQKNIPSNAIIVIDNYAFIDLNKKITNTIYVPQGGQYYWKIDEDPAIKVNILDSDWRKIDYMLVTHQMEYDMDHAGLSIVKDAYDHSTLLKRYPGDGWYVEIRKVNGTEDQLQTAWKYYSTHLVSKDGQSFDPQSNKTTSEAQSYALLRSVWVNDKKNYDKVLDWTTKNTLLKDKNLFAWWYGKKSNGTIGVVDKGTATDADEDIALSLLFAYKRWGNQAYLDQAKKIIDGIWAYETVSIKGNRYIVAGDWASDKSNTLYTVNPSYLSPYAYRIFSEVDKNHNWQGIVDSSYQVLSECAKNSLGKNKDGVLPPDWCALDKSGNVVSAKNVSDNPSNYSFDAMRVFWRLGLDYKWYKDPRDMAYLKNFNLFSDQWNKNKKIYSCYNHNGDPCNHSEALAQYGALLPYFDVVNNKASNEILDGKIISQWNSIGYWGNKNDYYDQNWVWFGIALHTNYLQNLWTTK